MRTQLIPANPFGPGRLGFAWQHVPAGTGAHLDFGCNDGAFLAGLGSKNIASRVGVDCNRDAIESAGRQHPELQCRHCASTVPLPFENATFDSVSLLDVLEHVYEQDELLAEIARVLKPGGMLIVTVPRKYALSFMDMGNMKFRFPRVHRWFYSARHGRAAYEERYLSNPDGLVGDVSARKRWHEHFSKSHLQEILRRHGLEPTFWDGGGFFTRLTSCLLAPIRRLGAIRAMERKLTDWDMKKFASMNLYCLAAKTKKAD